MMDKFSRREFIYLSASSFLLFPHRAYAIDAEQNQPKIDYPNTILVLKKAFKSEMTAHKHYLGYVEKALTEKFPNIAYMFHAFSISEKVHADNYKRIINKLGSKTDSIMQLIDVRDTKSNLITSTKNELKKIKTIYPNFLHKLEIEECEEAIINCMYSWKSHRQHEEKVKEMGSSPESVGEYD
ncbi:MAG: hypothetical protein K8R45_12590 [Desulfobacterales bacterium]|nr:hypothetical protein [Desulfobacterales bacterium]